MKRLFVIGGCNGAGKTTASYTILPEILDCDEFVNADEIAKGLSPFQPENAGIKAGRLMLERIKFLISTEGDFAFESTLATRSYKGLIENAKKENYFVTLIFFYLMSADMAVKRVETRVREGGHNIPENVIRRRYKNGLKNFFAIFKPIVHEWMFIDNSGDPYKIIAQKSDNEEKIYDHNIWYNIKGEYDEK